VYWPIGPLAHRLADASGNDGTRAGVFDTIHRLHQPLRQPITLATEVGMRHRRSAAAGTQRLEHLVDHFAIASSCACAASLIVR
jgi:hypothetical protein